MVHDFEKTGNLSAKGHIKGDCEKGLPGVLHHERNIPLKEENQRQQ